MKNQETTQEALLKDNLTLKDIVQFEIPALFRRQHLNRDLVVGLVGDIGAGKTIGGGMICLLDYLLQGEPCFANMQLKATFNVDAEIASKYGMEGGTATFEAKPLDKYKFLRFDKEYRGGVFFTHEFNIWLADARRSNSTLNLQTDDVGQELRKLESAWIYDCIHEMFVDMRIRDATDIFISTKDTALTPVGMARKQPQGIEFEWWIYPITQKGAAIMSAERYKDLSRPLGPIYIRGKQLWGLIDTKKREMREKYRANLGDATVELELGEPPEMVSARSKWGWLYEAIKTLHDEGYEEIHNEEMKEYLKLEERGLSPVVVGKQLALMGIRKRGAALSENGFYYLIDTFDLKKGIIKEKKVAVAV